MVSTIQSSELRFFSISARFPIAVSHIQNQNAPSFSKGELRLPGPSLLTEHSDNENKNH